jgi:hypothetical protein|tara:strand:+ start:897 stop:1151 length:255 start_codon:yes stop_codon:yes gene_type:complete
LQKLLQGHEGGQKNIHPAEPRRSSLSPAAVRRRSDGAAAPIIGLSPRLIRPLGARKTKSDLHYLRFIRTFLATANHGTIQRAPA